MQIVPIFSKIPLRINQIMPFQAKHLTFGALLPPNQVCYIYLRVSPELQSGLRLWRALAAAQQWNKIYNTGKPGNNKQHIMTTFSQRDCQVSNLAKH